MHECGILYSRLRYNLFAHRALDANYCIYSAFSCSEELYRVMNSGCGNFNVLLLKVA